MSCTSSFPTRVQIEHRLVPTLGRDEPSVWGARVVDAGVKIKLGETLKGIET